MKNLKIILTLNLMLFFAAVSMAQTDVLSNAGTALKTGNSRELSRHFSEIVEISFEGDKSSYSKTQAEFIIKDFFRKYPSSDFSFIHKGSSKEGLRYAIGKYQHPNGNFRVYMLIKQVKGKYVIDTLNFSDE